MINKEKDLHENPNETEDDHSIDRQEIEIKNPIELQNIENPTKRRKCIVISKKNQNTIQSKYANTSPLGTIGFGMATVMLNLANAGVYEINGMVLGLSFFHGGFGQLISGIFEIKKGNTFGATTFLSSTCFWFSFVTMWLCPFSLGCKETSDISLAVFNLFWGIFTAAMTVAVMKNGHLANKMMFIVLSLNFFLISIGLFSNVGIVVKIGGVFGVISGIFGIYIGCADAINTEFNHYLLPY